MTVRQGEIGTGVAQLENIDYLVAKLLSISEPEVCALTRYASYLH
jgi:hypothetical protein